MRREKQAVKSSRLHVVRPSTWSPCDCCDELGDLWLSVRRIVQTHHSSVKLLVSG